MDSKEEDYDTLTLTDFSTRPSGVDTITLDDMSTITISSAGYGSAQATFASAPIGIYGASTLTQGAYTTGTISGASWDGNVSVSANHGKLKLLGDEADIDINGVSLMETLKALQDRLNILRPNQELESEWDELRELGERYRALEAQLKEKTKMWNTLKSMPPPEIE